MKRTRIIALAFGGTAALTVAGALVLSILDGHGARGDHDGTTTLDQAEATTPTAMEGAPPQAATDILERELAGHIETAKVNPQDLAEPPPSAMPLAEDPPEFRDTETAEVVSQVLDGKDNTKKKGKKSAGRKIASVETKLSITVDRAATKISKNLDKKKVLDLLAKKLNHGCEPKLKEKTKAEISLSKSGVISNVKVTPKSEEKDLAKCIRHKLADAKALKPKNKSTAKITVQFKVK